ncbi:MAG TPA: hypothetical protein VGD36_11000, partial [Xanthobacteraceae bacterium]
EVRRIGAIDHVGGANIAGHFLAEALEQPLAAGAFDPDRDAGSTTHHFVLRRARGTKRKGDCA